ncbi:MAG: efflux RND transporter periplasmic adaptor subunit [Gemmatimonadetes bacterium]|nr:MAG: efflux RND transporter periplasmic adaptor subunit [Gemmatimonadota bacterium]PYP51972.1 MAG: efflux RND transporter periplasmic adaptor subunit [Gemmatimonadota bacterium]
MTRSRSIALAGAVAALFVIAAIAITARNHRVQQSSVNATQSTRTTQGMAGMPGMSVTDAGSVRLTTEQLRQFGVTFGTAEIRPLTAETRTTGVVTFDETRITQVAPKFGGFVEHLYINYTGQPVRRGQPLLEIYSPELVAAQQELLLAGQLQRDIGRSAVPGVPGNSTDLVTAAKRRFQFWDISEGQIDEILRTGKVRRTLTLFSPSSGVVVEKKVLQGQSIMAGEVLYTIADLTDVWVDVQLRETDAASVRPGSAAAIEVAGLPGRAFDGRVTYVYPTLDSASRSVRAKVVVGNPGGVLKPGMYATVRLATPSRSALTVPSSAVLRTGERNVVFVEMQNGELMPRDVELGRTAGDYTEILSGVQSGQHVVTSAQFLLDSESNLGDVMKAMIGQMSSGDVSKMQNMPGMSMPATSEKGADTRGMQSMPGMKPAATSTPRR